MPASPLRKESLWVSGTLWQRERLKLMLLDTRTGVTRLGGCAEMSPGISVASPATRIATLQLSALQPSSTSRYLNHVQRPELPADGQTTFQLEHEGIQYMFPAQMLIFAIFGDAHLRNYLLTADGLWHPAVMHRGRLLMAQRDTAQGDFYAWALSHKSAVACWRSIFAESVGAPLTVRPPRMLVRVKLKGVELGDVFAVTSARLLQFQTDEADSGWLNYKKPRSFIRTAKPGVLPWAEIVTREDFKSEELTDAQWQAIAPLVSNHWPEKRLRYIVNLIIRKHALPCQWRLIAKEKYARDQAKNLHVQLNRKGLWPTFVKAVQEAQRT